MGHLFRYQLLHIVREKAIIFWTLLFPLIMSTLFYVAFGDLGEEHWDNIPAAVVKQEENAVLEEVLQSLDGSVLTLTFADEQEAEQLLEEDEVVGIYLVKEKPELVVGASGIEESILESILDAYVSRTAMVKEMLADGRLTSLPAVLGRLETQENFVREVSLGGRNMDDVLVFFYALIGMTCLYGGFSGMYLGIQARANTSKLGARKCITPTHKMKMILVEMAVAFLVQYVCVLLVLGYLYFVLHIDLGGSPGEILLTTWMGSLIGVCLGIAMGSTRLKEGVKIGLFVGGSMAMSFLAGMMNTSVKYAVDRYCPIVNRLNPAALICDAFYCQAVYDDPGRLAQNLLILAAMCAVLLVVSFLSVRRERYDSI